ncbi:biotin/lipoyl-containing protein, partial [Pseudonocardia abyssalis]
MAFSVQMPALGESVTEGTVTRWLKQEGDRVEVDEPLLEVSTDKVDTEIPSPAAGVLQRIVAGEDETVEVGGELAVIGDGEESGGGDSGGGDASAEPAAQEEPEPEEAPAEEPSTEQEEPAEAPKAATASSGSGSSGTAITMPELGESVTEGTVTRWLKEVGDEVAVDEPLLEVSTDKVDTEIPSPVAGTLLEITAGEDATVEVGGQLAVIGDGSAAPATAEEKPAPEPEKEPEPKKEPEPAPKAEEKAPAEAPKAQEKAEREDVVAEQPSRPESNGSSGGSSGAADAPTGA